MISLLIVNYRSADLAVQAIRSARASSRAPLEVVAVDNSCDDREAAALRSDADVVLVSPANVGYAAAINRGRLACHGTLLVVSNPDVVFGSHAIDELAAAFAESSVAVAGPALFWDEAHTWFLPPSELHTAMEKFSAVLATRSALWAKIRDRRRIRKRLRFWSLRQTTPVPALSGAVMAIRADDFDACEGFDESFPLYFEETDFMRRLLKLGRRAVYVPEARCRHLYDQSAGENRAHAAQAYAHSEALYLGKWSGKLTTRLLKAIERAPRHGHAERFMGPLKLPHREVVVEASPLVDFSTAAGHFPSGDAVALPSEVWDAYRGEVLYVRTVDRTSGRPLATYARHKS